MLNVFCRFRFLILYLLDESGFRMCVACIFTKLWTVKFFGFLAPSSYMPGRLIDRKGFRVFGVRNKQGNNKAHKANASAGDLSSGYTLKVVTPSVIRSWRKQEGRGTSNGETAHCATPLSRVSVSCSESKTAALPLGRRRPYLPKQYAARQCQKRRRTISFQLLT